MPQLSKTQRHRLVALALALALALLVSACGGDEPCPEPSTVSYRAHVQFVMSRHCLSCHDVALKGLGVRNQAPESHNYNTYSEVFARADDIQRRLSAGDMPPGGGVPSCDKQTFASWIANGKPER